MIVRYMEGSNYCLYKIWKALICLLTIYFQRQCLQKLDWVAFFNPPIMAAYRTALATWGPGNSNALCSLINNIPSVTVVSRPRRDNFSIFLWLSFPITNMFFYKPNLITLTNK